MRALVSTSDKTGLIDFIKPLYLKGCEIVSTGGTYEFLKENGLKVMEVSELTGFPEVLDGRVKTLHPHVHMSLLADTAKADHISALKLYNLRPFDLVVGNLYPFEKVAAEEAANFEDLIENIDIGGPSFLRASAKNFKSVAVVCNPADYPWVQKKILDDTLSFEDRKKLALKVFSLTSYYDALIFNRLSQNTEHDTEYLNIPLKKKSTLRYGENAHQKASWYVNPLENTILSEAFIHQGKELSYNNLLDLDSAIELVTGFNESACVAVKHNNPCGVGIGKNAFDAGKKTIDSDPKSIFGGILAFNRLVDAETCLLFKDIFIECVAAPDFSEDALQILSKKKNLRVLSLKKDSKANSTQLRSVKGGVLVQDNDIYLSSTESWKVFGDEPSDKIKNDMLFAEKVAGSLKSNAIAIVCNGQSVGLGMGQVNRVDAVAQAITRMQDFKSRMNVGSSDFVLASDAFFPFPDSIQVIADAGIKWVVQPGGSVQDESVIEYSRSRGVNLTLTGKRHFRH